MSGLSRAVVAMLISVKGELIENSPRSLETESNWSYMACSVVTAVILSSVLRSNLIRLTSSNRPTITGRSI